MGLAVDFPLHLQLLFEEKLSETVKFFNSEEELKRMIVFEFGFEKDDLKLFFEDHEMKTDERLENLVALGFRKDSPLHVEFANAFPIFVEFLDRKTRQFAIQSETTMLQLRKRVERNFGIPLGLISIECDGRVVDDYEIVREVCVEGKKMKAEMKDSSLCELFSPSEKITEESVSKMIEEVKTMVFCELNEIATKELFSKLNELMKQYEDNSKMTLLLTLLAEEIAFKGAIHSDFSESNDFFSGFEQWRCCVEFESIFLQKRRNDNLKDIFLASFLCFTSLQQINARHDLILHSSFAYCLMMKSQYVSESTMFIILRTLLSHIIYSSSNREDRINRPRCLLALRGICEDYGFSVLFVFKSSFLLLLLIQLIREQ
jgi:hypothetical protein